MPNEPVKLILTNSCKIRLVTLYGHTEDTLSGLLFNHKWVIGCHNEDGSVKVQMETLARGNVAFVCMKVENDCYLALGLTSPHKERKGPSQEEQAKDAALKQAKRDANRLRDEALAREKKEEKARLRKEAEERTKRKAEEKEQRRMAHEAFIAKQMSDKKERKDRAFAESLKTAWTPAQKAEYWAEQARLQSEQEAKR